MYGEWSSTSGFVCSFKSLECDLPTPRSKDNDDDGETAAGGRIAHLLQILVSFNNFPELDHSLKMS